MLLRKETFEYDGATFEVHGATGLSELDKRELLQMLEGKTGRSERHNSIYAELIAHTSRTENAEAFGFTVPPPTASLEEHLAAFPLIMGMPLEFVDGWYATVMRVQRPPASDPELQPGVVAKSPKSKKSA